MRFLLVVSLFLSHISENSLNNVNSISKLSARDQGHENDKSILNSGGRVNVSVPNSDHGDKRKIKSRDINSGKIFVNEIAGMEPGISFSLSDFNLCNKMKSASKDMSNINYLEYKFTKCPGRGKPLLDSVPFIDVGEDFSYLVKSEKVDRVKVLSSHFKRRQNHCQDGGLVNPKLELQIIGSNFSSVFYYISVKVKGSVKS